MTGKQVSDAVRDLYNSKNGNGIGSMTAIELGIDDKPEVLTENAGSIMRVEINFVLKNASAKDLSAELRQELRTCLSKLADVPVKRVMIDGVRQQKVGTKGLGEKELIVNVKITIGNDMEKSYNFVELINGRQNCEMCVTRSLWRVRPSRETQCSLLVARNYLRCCHLQHTRLKYVRS